MTEIATEDTKGHLPSTMAKQQTAEVEITFRPARLHAQVNVTPNGLLAIGGLVSSILLSTAVLVWAATSGARRRPIATRIWPN